LSDWAQRVCSKYSIDLLAIYSISDVDFGLCVGTHPLSQGWSCTSTLAFLLCGRLATRILCRPCRLFRNRARTSSSAVPFFPLPNAGSNSNIQSLSLSMRKRVRQFLLSSVSHFSYSCLFGLLACFHRLLLPAAASKLYNL